MSLEFSYPLVLIFLVSIPLLYYLYRLSLRRKRAAAIRFSNIGLIKSVSGRGSRREHIVFYLTIIAVSLIIIGLADPMIPLEQTKEGVNVVLVIDNSGSMQATDYQPTRLEAAKASAATLINSLHPKDDVGVVLFESGATTGAYLSPFKSKVLEKLSSVAPKDGRTALGDGLAMGIDMATSIPNKKKVVILLSDGVHNAGVISPPEAVEFAKINNIQVYTVGMGSEQPVVLAYDFFGNPQYAELDEETLKMIARETGGKYYKSVDSATLDYIYKNIGEDIEREKELTSIQDWFFVAAGAILIFELYIRHGKYRIIS